MKWQKNSTLNSIYPYQFICTSTDTAADRAQEMGTIEAITRAEMGQTEWRRQGN